MIDIEMLSAFSEFGVDLEEKNLVILDIAVFKSKAQYEKHIQTIKNSYPDSQVIIKKVPSGRFLLVFTEELPTYLTSIELKMDDGLHKWKICKNQNNELEYIEVFDLEGLLIKAKTKDVIEQWISLTGLVDKKTKEELLKKLDKDIKYILYGNKS